MKYERLASVPSHLIIEAMNREEIRFDLGDGTKIKISGSRMRTYTKGIHCVHCGIEGHFFSAERQKHGSQRPLHFNFYHRTEDGRLIMMTSDHIVAKARGGAAIALSNRQPMCIDCNSLKADYATIEEAIAVRDARLRAQNCPEFYVKKLNKQLHAARYALPRIGTQPKWKYIYDSAIGKIEKYKRVLREVYNVDDYEEINV